MPKRRKTPRAMVTLAAEPWDHGPAIQRGRRAHRVTERGETDAKTGKVINPNNIRGIRYLTVVEDLHAQGILDREHVHAAEHWAQISHAVLGSPAQRSCLNTDPIGYDRPEAPRYIRDQYREVCGMLGAFERRLLDAVCYRLEPCPVTRYDLLKRGLTVVAEFYAPRRKRVVGQFEI